MSRQERIYKKFANKFQKFACLGPASVAEIEGGRGGGCPPKATKNCINFLGIDPRLAHLSGHCWALPPPPKNPSYASGLLVKRFFGVRKQNDFPDNNIANSCLYTNSFRKNLLLLRNSAIRPPSIKKLQCTYL